MATTLGSVAEGSIVYLNESGSPVPFYVVKHNYEATLNGNGRTALLRKEVYDTRKWHSGSNSVYTTSAIDAWLNSTYKSTLDAYIQEQISETTFEVFAGNGDMTVVTVSRAIFLPALKELRSDETDVYGVGDTFPVASTVRKLSTSYWTRTASSTSPRVQLINTSGTTNAGIQSTTSGSRPMFTLPETMNVDDSNNVTEPVAQILPHSAMIDDVACLITQCYAEVEIVRCPVAYGLTTIDGVTMTIPFGPSAETIEQYPSIVGNLTYNGSAQSPQWADYDSSKMSIGGTQSGTNAGSYTTTFTPLEGYVWPDGSTDAYSVTWNIAKAAGSVTLSKTIITLGSGESTTFTVTRSGDGAISASSNNTGKATATLSGTNVTVKGVATGSATITVSVAEGTNHLAASATCAVTVAQLYTVTIKKHSNSSYPSNSVSIAYFQINGTKYPGAASAVTLSVAKNTSYTAFAKIYNSMTDRDVGAVTLNGNQMAMGGSYSGKITANTTVEIGYGATQYYSIAAVDITTS